MADATTQLLTSKDETFACYLVPTRVGTTNPYPAAADTPLARRPQRHPTASNMCSNIPGRPPH
ncbi:Uncharacterised protein [Mycobacteroides abscessus subsp. abscessus]|nr:Uncharacterised protein [Mycobacteroides abscessus subsp. abscessus]